MVHTSIGLTTAGLVALLPLSAATQTVRTGSFDVRITIAAECEVTSTEALDFGTAGVLTSNVEASATLEVTCTNTTPYAIGLNEGLDAGGTTDVRLMSSGADTISYGLFQDSARSINWGDTVGTDTQAAVGSGSAQAYTVYGQVLAQATPAPGAYTDTVTVTVTY